MKTKFYSGILLLSMLCFFSCKEEKKDDPDTQSLTNVDVSAYDKWVYLSFESGTPIEKEIDEEAPEKWDIAMHRNNIKTNQGSALKTEITSLAALTEVPAGSFVSDVKDSIIVDMSQMMQGFIRYEESDVNPVLGTWVTRAGMPPVYTVSGQVFVVRNKDGQYAKIKFTSYKDDMDNTGFASFNYVYPF